MNENITLRLENAIRNRNGTAVAKYFDVRYLTQNRGLCSDLSKSISSLNLSDLWENIFAGLVKIPELVTENERLEEYIKCTSYFIRDFADIPSELSIPCLIQVSKSFRYYATSVDYNESVNHMQKLLKLGLSIKAFVVQRSPLLAIVNDLMASYFMRNLFTQAENLLRSVDNNARHLDFSLFSRSEVTTYQFNKGKILAIKMELKEAKENLMNAFETCPFSEMENRRLILLYLIPVMFSLGEMPSTELLNKYNMDIYMELTNAFINGDLKLFNDSFDKHQFLFIKLGLFELICYSKKVIYYQLFRMVLAKWNNVKVPVTAFQNALKLFIPSMSLLETESILCSLIDKKLIKAYIYHKSHIVVFCKETPFLPINESV